MSLGFLGVFWDKDLGELMDLYKDNTGDIKSYLEFNKVYFSKSTPLEDYLNSLGKHREKDEDQSELGQT